MRKISPALVVSVIAIVLAVTGTAVASHYIITSTKQIKPSVRNALKGNRGATGSPGVLDVVKVDSPVTNIPPGGNSFDAGGPDSLDAQCPSGYTVVGTGIDTGIGNVDFVLSYGTFVGAFVDNDTSITIQAHSQAVCALVPALAGRRSSRAGAGAYLRDLRKAEADRLVRPSVR